MTGINVKLLRSNKAYRFYKISKTKRPYCDCVLSGNVVWRNFCNILEGQCHKVINLSVIWKVIISGVCTSLYLLIKARKKDKRTNRTKNIHW